MSKSETIRAVIFKDSKMSNLDEIQKKVNNSKVTIEEKINFNKDFKKIAESLPNSDKTLYYSWNKTQPINSIQYDSPEGEIIPVSYLKAEICLEISSQQKYDKTRMNILPKDKRVDKKNITVMFLSAMGGCYCLIFTGNDTYFRRCLKLITETTKSGLEISRLDRQIFTWLFFVNDSVKRNITKLVSVADIEGFVGTLQDDDLSLSVPNLEYPNKITGNAQRLSKMFVTKAFISLGYKFTGVQIELKMKKEDKNISNANTGMKNVREVPVYDTVEVSFDEEKTIKLTNNGSNITTYYSSEGKVENAVLYIYSLRFPLIIETYNTKKDMFMNELPIYSAKLGKEVIDKIVSKNPSVALLNQNDIKKELDQNIVN